MGLSLSVRTAIISTIEKYHIGQEQEEVLRELGLEYEHQGDGHIALIHTKTGVKLTISSTPSSGKRSHENTIADIIRKFVK